jgi:hypothetical protein
MLSWFFQRRHTTDDAVCDENFVYQSCLTDCKVVFGKRNTHVLSVSICLCVLGAVVWFEKGFVFQSQVLCIERLLV